MEENKELANGIGKAAEKALDFIEKIIAGPLMEGTGIFTDKVKFWRFKNQVDIITKAKEYLRSKGIETPKQIPIKDVTTLLEYASFEEDEIMQDCWSKLLSNTLNPENTFDACHIFSQILNQLSVSEIYALNYMFINCFQKSSDDRPYFEKKDLIRKCQTGFENGILIIDNLIRLKLIEEEPPKLIENVTEDTYNFDEKIIKTEIVRSERYRMSKFGIELLRQITN